MKLMKKNPQPAQASNGALHGYEQFKHVFGIIVTWLYHLRKVVLAVPVVYVALRLAAYNTVNYTTPRMGKGEESLNDQGINYAGYRLLTTSSTGRPPSGS